MIWHIPVCGIKEAPGESHKGCYRPNSSITPCSSALLYTEKTDCYCYSGGKRANRALLTGGNRLMWKFDDSVTFAYFDFIRLIQMSECHVWTKNWISPVKMTFEVKSGYDGGPCCVLPWCPGFGREMDRPHPSWSPCTSCISCASCTSCTTVESLSCSFSFRLLRPQCEKEQDRRSLLPAVFSLYNCTQ